MDTVIPATVDAKERVSKRFNLRRLSRAVAPPLVALTIALLPIPSGLPHHAWYYFAIFTGVVLALVLEPLPSPAIGVIGVTLVTLLARWVLISPEDFAKPGFDLPSS